jgi:hypothetical protein
MKTDRLIEILGANVEPVSARRLRVTVVLALVVGAIGALCLMLATVGPRTDIGANLPSLAIKLGFALAVAAAGSAFLARSMRPGQHSRRLLALMWLPFIALGAVAVAALAMAEPASWGALVLGTAWWSCLVCVPIFAAVPFAALIGAARNGAPTSPARTGAAAGLVAGAFGVAAYALHGPDDFVPFIAVWYSAAIGLCALVGALLGRRLLQW